MKKWILIAVRSFWWIAVARLPLSIRDLSASYAEDIGCPPRGDCYVPGSEILLSFDILVMGSAVLLWPVCFWFLGGKWVAKKLSLFPGTDDRLGISSNRKPADSGK